jgi:hypothetical protein
MMEEAAESALAVLKKMTADTVADRVDPQADAGLTYSRFSKALRQALMLHARFEEDSYKTRQERAAEAAARQAAEARRAAAVRDELKAKQKRQVTQAVKRAMDVELAEDDERGVESRDYGEFLTDLHERLDDYDEYSDFGNKPVGAVVADLCKLLSLPFDPALWEDEPWAIEEAKAKPPGSPFAHRHRSANDDEDDPGADDEDADRSASPTKPTLPSAPPEPGRPEGRNYGLPRKNRRGSESIAARRFPPPPNPPPSRGEALKRCFHSCHSPSVGEARWG